MAADAAAIRKFLSRFNKDGLVDVASAIGVELTPTMKGLQKGKLLDEVVATFVRGFFVGISLLFSLAGVYVCMSFGMLVFCWRIFLPIVRIHVLL